MIDRFEQFQNDDFPFIFLFIISHNIVINRAYSYTL